MKRSVAVVIDADIAQAAGSADARDPRSRLCRRFLLEVLEICHKLVWSREIATEWKNHSSGFARKWRVKMTARKKIRTIDAPALTGELAAVVRDSSEKDGLVLAKDWHLLSAAAAADGVLVTGDRRAVASLSRLRRRPAAISEVRALVLQDDGDALTALLGVDLREVKDE